MSMKDFDKLEEKIGKMVKVLKTLKDENAQLRAELKSLSDSTSQRDVERTEIKKKVTALIELVDSIEA
jgi:regulator of replication initiation timing